MNPVTRIRTAIFLLLAATFPATAQEVSTAPATPVTTPAAQPREKAPWRGSELVYGHAATAYTFNPGAELHYNPTWLHHLELRPEWHFGKQLSLRGRLDVGQELTLSDSTTRRNEVVWGEPFIEARLAGWEDPWAHVRLAPSVRVMGGFSKASWAQTQLGSIGPGVELSRRFPVLKGVTVLYEARLTQRFHRFTTGRQESSDVASFCFDPASIECQVHAQNGVYNSHTDLTHDLVVAVQPLEKLSFDGAFVMRRDWLYTPAELPTSNPLENPGTRDAWGFTARAVYQVLPELSLTLGSSTFAGQLDLSSQRQNPFFNRYTQLYLDLGLDVEAALERI